MPGFTESSQLFLLALLPAIAWIVVYRYLDSREPEPMPPALEALFLGSFCTIPVFLLQYLFNYYPDFNLLAILQQNLRNTTAFSIAFLLFVAVIEETVKAGAFLTLFKKQEKNFNQIVDGIFYGAMIGLGFAIAENTYYFFKAVEVFEYSKSFWAVFAIRSFGTMLAHTLFTGIFGFYFAKAYFSPFVDQASKKTKFWHGLHRHAREAIRLHVTFFHLLPDFVKAPSKVHRNVVILEGYFIAILLHLIYNVLIKVELFGKSWTFLMIPMIFLIAWWVWGRFFVNIYTRIIDFIRVRREMYRLRVH